MIRTTPPGLQRNYVTVLSGGQDDPLSEVRDADIVDLFKRYGAVLFRGFSLDLPTFNAVTCRFCSNYAFNESGGRQTVSRDGRTQTVNLGQEPFPMHSELSREPWRPDIAWFACVKPPLRGGETLLCDGLAVVPGLSEETRRILTENRLEHRIAATPEECERWLGVRNPDEAVLRRQANDSPFVFSASNGQCYRTFYAPVLHEPMFSEELAFANFLLFARFYHHTRDFPTFENGIEIPDDICLELKQITDQLTVAVRWQKHDLLMVDNTRFMHGRNAVEDASHRIILTQFGYASFAPQDQVSSFAQPWRMHSVPPRGAASA